MRTKGLKDRTVHLLDLENMVGSGHLTESAVRRVRAAYVAAVVVAPGDLVILGVSHQTISWQRDLAGPMLDA